MSPVMNEALAGGAVQGFGDIAAVNPADSASDATDCKAFNTLRAQFSLKGWTLVMLADGALIAGRWGNIRTLDTLSQAAALLALIGGAA